MTEKTIAEKFSTKACFGFLLLSIVLIALDQWTKLEIVRNFEYGERLPITSYFDLYYLRNFGAAFSFLSDAGGWQKIFFVTLSSVVCIGIVIWLFFFSTKQQKILTTAMSLVLAGAFGNLIDRINYGYVVDFLSFHHEAMANIPLVKIMFSDQGRFPAFNVADMAIFCGAFLLIVDWYLEVRRENALAKAVTETVDPRMTY